MSSHALDVDATGNTTLKELQESEARLIRNAALARSVCLERGDAFGSRLDQIRASLPRASDKGTPDAIHKQVVAQSTLLKQSGARSNACTKRKLDSLPRCFVSIPSPEKALGVMSTKLSKKARISSATDKVSCLPLGEARIYKNWSHRRCFGHECVNEIAMGEWFVNMPVMNQVPSTGHTEHQNIGFCLRTEGQCLATPAAHIASLMRRCGYRFPTSLPILSGDDRRWTSLMCASWRCTYPVEGVHIFPRYRASLCGHTYTLLSKLVYILGDRVHTCVETRVHTCGFCT